MPKSNLQKKSSYYERIIEEAKNSPHAEHYKSVCTALEPLIALSEQLKDGNRKMTANEYKSLMNNYTAVMTACKDYIEKKDEFDDFEKSRMKIVQELGNVLSRDLKALKDFGSKEAVSLSEVMERSRTYTVEISSEEIKTVGGVLSSRIPLKTINGKKGFFTAKKIFNQADKWKEKVEAYEAKFAGISELCTKRINLLKTNNKVQRIISNICPKPNASKFDPDTISSINGMAGLLGMVEKTDDAPAFLSNNPEIFNNLYDFCMDIASIAKQESIMNIAGIETGSDITTRNCAMTDVARLLGCDNLLANSAPMKVIIDGVEVEGVFMETAEGSDIGNIQEDDLFMEAKAYSFENPNVLEQIADLQVVDFICGNTDRHAGNMIYQFEKNNNSRVMLGGIKGIDNDCSFGTPEIKEGKKIMRMVNPENMKYISAHMAITLTTLTPEMLRAELMNSNLSEKEITAACDRLDMVKKEIEKGNIEIKSKEQWKDYSLFLDETVKNNYFGDIQLVQAACELEDFKKQKDVRKKDIQYVQGRRNDAAVLVNRLDTINHLKEVMIASKAKIFNSSEYNSMKKRFDKIEKLTKQIKEEYTSKKLKVPDELTETLKNTYNQMIEKTEKYIALKKLLPETERGKKRVEFARQLLDFAYETVEKIPQDMENKAAENENRLFEPDNSEAGYDLENGL